ncbi:MAG: hypothetical protein Alpg2KO_31580 [Alphaproteobacteria bacterium]
MRLNISTLRGQISRIAERDILAGERAVAKAMRGVGFDLRDQLRGQTRRAFASDRLARSWRANSYPRGGGSLNAATVVKSRAEAIFTGFERGAIIRAAKGKYLAIPAPDTPKLMYRRRATPANWEKRFRRKLIFVERPYGGLLIDRAQASRGKRGPGFRRPSARALRTGRGLVSRPIFILVKQARLPRKMNINSAANSALSRLPGRIAEEWARQIKD